MTSEVDLINSLPQDQMARTLQAISMIYESALNFFKSHTLKFEGDSAVGRALNEGEFFDIKDIFDLLFKSLVHSENVIPSFIDYLAPYTFLDYSNIFP